VKITVNENMYSSLFQFCVTVSNEYETKKIYVSITPSDRYIFDRITYSLDAYSYTDKQIEERKSIVVNNRGDESIVTNYIFPFKDEHRQIQFTSNNPEAFNLLADSKPEVEIPGIVDGHLVMNGELARYASDMQQLPLPFLIRKRRRSLLRPKLRSVSPCCWNMNGLRLIYSLCRSSQNKKRESHYRYFAKQDAQRIFHKE